MVPEVIRSLAARVEKNKEYKSWMHSYLGLRPYVPVAMRSMSCLAALTSSPLPTDLGNLVLVLCVCVCLKIFRDFF